jgi:molybdopterin-guanine dinucleotide biosynthesis protein A/thiamine kinase-like enzyme
MNNAKLTVLILAAGYGRRMGPFSRMIPKALIPYDNKPLVSHILDKFDKNTRFVIACGHMGNLIKDYVNTVHSDKDVVFVDVPNYAEGETGPATSIQACAKYLRGGFMWLACDTLFDFDFKDKLDHNWIGVHPVDSGIAQDYCWVEREASTIVAVHNKTASNTAVDAFVGLMYAKDDEYLDNLIARRAKETYQGFAGLEMSAHTVRGWRDFGTYEKWEELSSQLVDVSFPKPDELFYTDNSRVIKFWTNPRQAELRVARAKCNPNAMPDRVENVGNFLIHDFARGDIVYNQHTPDVFKRMLEWCEQTLWCAAPELASERRHAICRKFYYEKTQERVDAFRVKYSDWSEAQEVNGQPVLTINQYLERIDFDWLCATNHWSFIHGDLHFDNTIYDSGQFEGKMKIYDAELVAPYKFTAIDWRTDFGGELYGDLYYDLAKMLGGLHLDYSAIKHMRYGYAEQDDRVSIAVPSVTNVQIYEQMLKQWVESQGLEWRKVKLLVPLIYLNMSPLHEAPFDKFLVALAQLHFAQVLDV